MESPWNWPTARPLWQASHSTAECAPIRGNRFWCCWMADKRDAPASDRVALLAGGAELPPMDVGVAVGAPRPHVAEDQAGVALHAAQVGVTAA